jgi:putrescine importer
MGVNLAAIRKIGLQPDLGVKREWLAGVVVPALGFVFCLWIWWSLPVPAKIAGGLWFAFGSIYLAVKTRGFHVRPAMIDFTDL